MFFLAGAGLLLNLSALLFPPLLFVAIPVDVIVWRYLDRRATRYQEAAAEQRFEDLLAFWSGGK